MKNLMKKYYELDDEIKDDLEMLYIYQMILSINNEYPNITINNLTEMENLMEVILKCTYCTGYSIDDIITNIFETISCRDITIKDLDNLEIDELVDILFNDSDYEEEYEETDNEFELLSSFKCLENLCFLYKNNAKYNVVLIRGEKATVLTFDTLGELMGDLFENKLRNLNLYG